MKPSAVGDGVRPPTQPGLSGTLLLGSVAKLIRRGVTIHYWSIAGSMHFFYARRAALEVFSGL